MSLFTSFDGSIGRGQFWLGILALAVIGIVVAMIVGPLLLASPSAGAIFSLVMSLVLLYPAAAIITKRLHDRGKPMSPWLWIFIGPGIVFNVLQALGIGFTPVNLGGAVVMQPNGIGLAMSVIVMVIGIWALIELGILKGRR